MAKKLIKYMKKLKKMLFDCKSTSANIAAAKKDDQQNTSVANSSPPSAIHCDELFYSKGHGSENYINDVADHNPFLVAHIAAHRHFALRPNIYLL